MPKRPGWSEKFARTVLGKMRESNDMSRMKANLGDLYSFRLLGGGYGVAQILATDHFIGADRVLLAPLDFYSAIPPMPSMVDSAFQVPAIRSPTCWT